MVDIRIKSFLFQACGEIYSTEEQPSNNTNMATGNSSRKPDTNHVNPNWIQHDTQMDLFPEEGDDDLYANYEFSEQGNPVPQCVDGTWDDDDDDDDDVTMSDQSSGDGKDVIGHRKSQHQEYVVSLDGTCDNPSGEEEPESPIPLACRRRTRSASTPLGQKRTLSDNSPNKLSRSNKKRPRRTLYTESEGSIYTPRKEGKSDKLSNKDAMENLSREKENNVSMSSEKESDTPSSSYHSLQNVSSDNEVQFNVNVNSEQNSSLLDAADNFSDQRDENGELYDAQDERNMEDYENPNFNGESRSKYRAPGDAEQYGYQTQYNDADDYDSIDSSNDPDSGANAGADIKREEHLNVPNRNSSSIKKMVSQYISNLHIRNTMSIRNVYC